MRLLVYCRQIVDSPSFEHKLAPPPADLFDVDDRGPTYRPTHPGRDPSIALVGKHEGKLPKLHMLKDADARVAVLSRFAHHELCAVELFAWAVLAFPDLSTTLRRGFIQTLAEEQVHCRLYLARLEAHGARFGALPLSDYFWKHVDKLTTPEAFLCAMGLTLEQANLDFTLMYKDAFAKAGDDETARVIERVHEDEIGHVKLANTWLKKLANQSDVDAYAAHVPFPFALARAKGRHFDVNSRQRAALSDALIDAVRNAKPYSSARDPRATRGRA